jgi:hypothetical protein
VLVKVSATVFECPPATFTAHGRQLPPLSVTTSFDRRVAAVAGLPVSG